MGDKAMKFATRAIHAGQEPDPTTGAVCTPIYQTSTYVQEGLNQHKGYEYARTHNLTREALEACLASMETADYGLCFGSGLAAEGCIMHLLSAGDHVVCGDDVYGGTYRLFEKVWKRYGLTFTYVDASDAKKVEAAIQPNTKLIWVETPTNPLLRLCDIKAIAAIGKSKKLITVVDNTFASPYLQNPIAMGIDIVVHSVTKYLGGHSDVVGGAVLTSRQDLYETLKFHQNAVGAVPGPFDCFLVLRGVKTLAVRMEAHQKKCHVNCPIFGKTSGRRKSNVSGSNQSSPARAGQIADEWLWRHGQFCFEGWPRKRQTISWFNQTFCSG